jgi:hypothetical protein
VTFVPSPGELPASAAGDVNVHAGWLAMAFGVLSGAVIGLGFHRDEWLGGYASFRRRLLRLGHISFFGLGALNVLYGLSTAGANGRGSHRTGSTALLVAAVAMPSVCFLAAWRRGFRHLFALPVGAAALGVVCAIISTGGTKR